MTTLLLPLTKMAINPFEHLDPPEREPETFHKVKPVIDDQVERALRQYQRTRWKDWRAVFKQARRLTDIVLRPAQIDLLLQCIEGTTDFEVDTAGIYISSLVQKSYHAGNNNFVMRTNGIPFDHLGTNLEGTKRKPIVLRINGNVGEVCGDESHYCRVVIDGNVGCNCGEYSRNCEYMIDGVVGDDCGWNASKCTFIIDGSVHDGLGERAQGCTFTIHGPVGDKCGMESERCTYSVHGPSKDLLGADATECVFIVDEDVGMKCGSESKKSTFVLKRNVGEDYGLLALDSCFTVFGNVEEAYRHTRGGCTFIAKCEETYRKMRYSFSTLWNEVRYEP